jgi:hypothetical protein
MEREGKGRAWKRMNWNRRKATVLNGKGQNKMEWKGMERKEREENEMEGKGRKQKKMEWKGRKQKKID